MCTSNVPHHRIFQPHQDTTEHPDKDTLSLMDDLGLRGAHKETQNMSIFTGEEELFAFERTISRLAQMTTPEYWELYELEHRWRGGGVDGEGKGGDGKEIEGV